MPLLALVGFCLGAAIAAWMVKELGSGCHWSKRLHRTLSLAAAFLLVGGGAASLPNQYAVLFGIALVAAAMGIQSASIQQLPTGGISTNVVTSTLTAAVTRLVNLLPLSHPDGKKIQDPQLHLSCWCAYLLGAVIGGITSQVGLWLPFSLSLLVVVVLLLFSQFAAKGA